MVRLKALAAVIALIAVGFTAKADEGTENEFIVDYLGKDGFGMPYPTLSDEHKAAVKRATDLWAEALEPNVPIRIAIYGHHPTKFLLDGQGEILRDPEGNAFEVPSYSTGMSTNNSTHYLNNSAFTFPQDVLFVPSLASHLTGQELVPNYDYFKRGMSGVHAYIGINLNLDKETAGHSEWWYGEDGSKCPYGKYDATDTFVHEIGHVLGLASAIKDDGSHTKYGLRRATVADQFLTAPYPIPDEVVEPIADLMYSTDGTKDEARRKAIVGGLVQWGGAKGNTIANALCSYSCSDIDEDTHQILMSVQDVSHTRDTELERLMDPFADSGPADRSLDFAIGMVGDIGWDIVLEPQLALKPESFVQIRVVSTGATGTAIFRLYNVGTASAAGNISLKENNPEFAITSGGGLFQLSIGEVREIIVSYTAGAAPIATDSIVVTQISPKGPTIEKKFSGRVDPGDSDNDGLSDDDESKDLSSGSKSFWNPFDPDLPDSTGDNNSDVGDGVLDGFNDYDGDGYGNALEFFYGSSPVDLSSLPEIADQDQDGLIDFDELRDLDLDTSGFQNPFSQVNEDFDGNGIRDGEDDYDEDGMTNSQEFMYAPYFDPIESDMSGDDGVLVADTVLDGQNDFDDDGFANMDETRYGHNPLVPNSIMDLEWLCCPE
jgi:hypothetical protein